MRPLFSVRHSPRLTNMKGVLETIDPGVPDKRLMITESEFANALEVMERPGNTLSPNLRNGWDGQTLSTLTKNSPLKASNPHISIVGHITEDELRARITRTDMANGFANRFLFACVRRSKLLPHGGNLADADVVLLGEKIGKAATFAKTVGRVEMTELARREWETIYPHLSAEQQGLLGAMTARAEAQTIRLGSYLRPPRRRGRDRGCAPQGSIGCLGVLRNVRRANFRKRTGRPHRRRDHAGAAGGRQRRHDENRYPRPVWPPSGR